MKLTNNRVIDFENIKDVNYIDIVSGLEEMLCENNGSFSVEDQSVSFDVDGDELIVLFELNVNGNIDYDPGDYWTAPFTDVNITDIDVCITRVCLDDCELSLDKETIVLLEGKIKNLV
jgi:hypothetical protein